jgi:hypothetical protein
MRKLSVKIAIILFAIFFTIIAAISTLVLLINSGKLTHFIEHRIKTDTNIDIKIKDIHLNIFSDLQLKQIRVKGFSGQEQYTLGCNTITIRFKPFDLLKRQIQNINISDVQMILNAEREKTVRPPSSHDYEFTPFNLKDVYPERLLIENVSINNTKVTIMTGGYLFAVTEMDMQIKEIQPAKPFDISIHGNFSLSHTRNTAQSNLTGKIDINTKYNLPDDELSILDSSYFLVNDLEKFSINGKVCSIFSSPEIDCNISAHDLPVNNVPDLLNSFQIQGLPSLASGGTGDFNLSARGTLKKLKVSSKSLIHNLSLKTEKITFQANVVEIPIEATLTLFNPEGILHTEGKGTIHQGHLQAANGQITSLEIPIEFTVRYPGQIILSSELIRGKLHYGSIHFPINELISNIKTNVDLKQPGKIQFQIQIDTKFSDPAHIIGNIDMRKNVIRDITLKTHNISGKDLSKTLKSIIPENYKDWSLDGNISLSTTIKTITDNDDKDKSQNMATVTDLSLSQLKFSSPDYDHFAEGINGHIKIKMNTDSDFQKFSFSTKGTIEPFLIQLGVFTTDMRSRKTYLSLNGNYDNYKKKLTGIRGDFSCDDLGTLTAVGEIRNITDNPQIDMNIELKKFDNTVFFETFVKDTIQYSNPVLFTTHIEGESNSLLSIKGPKNNLAINGHININDLSLKYGDTAIEDASVELPISMVYPRSGTLIRKQDIPDSQYGTVQLKKLSYGPLKIEDIRISPIIISNNFFIREPFKVPVFDGTIDIRDVSVENVINSDRKIRLEFQLNNINLKEMTTTYKLTPFEGVLNSSIMSFHQQGEKLYSNDEINIKLFGGSITIRDLTLNNFMKSMREIGFSAEVNHLDLGQMSNTYREWGNITGIINGHIKDFKLVAREPSSFQIEMKTERHPKIKQTVSAKFIKNFVPGVGKVLDKVGFTNYKYEIMGLNARLENDYIKLQGAVRKGGKELFMKGAGLKKLDIVFPNIDRKVPFKTFMNSFKGILDSDFDDTQVQFK